MERRWSYLQVEWGKTLCAARCGRTAEMLLDGEPYCADDAERLIERQQLLAEHPDLAAMLRPVFRVDDV